MLKIALFERAKRVIPSQTLFCKERQEPIAKNRWKEQRAKSKRVKRKRRAKERIPNLPKCNSKQDSNYAEKSYESGSGKNAAVVQRLKNWRRKQTTVNPTRKQVNSDPETS